jgi:hypothetical protein
MPSMFVSLFFFFLDKNKNIVRFEFHPRMMHNRQNNVIMKKKKKLRSISIYRTLVQWGKTHYHHLLCLICKRSIGSFPINRFVSSGQNEKILIRKYLRKKNKPLFFLFSLGQKDTIIFFLLFVNTRVCFKRKTKSVFFFDVIYLLNYRVIN